MTNPKYLKRGDTGILVVIFLVILMIVAHNCDAQVIYNSWSSTQVRHAVEVEKPEHRRDTIESFGKVKIEDTFSYKGFKIILTFGDRADILVLSNRMSIILKPEDEYAVIEKLLSLLQ